MRLVGADKSSSLSGVPWCNLGLMPKAKPPPLVIDLCRALVEASAERPVGYWFSIDDRDPASKNLFSFILLLFTFVETGSTTAAPIFTIPTTR